MASSDRKKDGFWETIKTVFWALVIAMAFRSILYQPFSIPSGSMKPTLLVGDYLFVSKFAYGYSKHSLPFSPDLFDGRIWAGDGPERGDVVVFKKPGADTCSEGPLTFIPRIASNLISMTGLTSYRAGPDDCIDYIKRVVGLPGDKVQMVDGVVHINGQRVGMDQAPDIPDRDAQARTGTHFTEELPGGKRHSILDEGRGQYDDTDVIVVKPGHILFLGDNRDNSQDSRFPSVGQVPIENLIGRADVVALSSAGAFWEIWDWRWPRFFSSIE